mgnify:CR=1
MAKVRPDHEQIGFGIVGPLNINFLSNNRVRLEVPQVWVRDLRRSLRGETKGVTITPDDQGPVTTDEAVQTGRRRTPANRPIRLEVTGENKVRIGVRAFQEAKQEVFL